MSMLIVIIIFWGVNVFGGKMCEKTALGFCILVKRGGGLGVGFDSVSLRDS